MVSTKLSLVVVVVFQAICQHGQAAITLQQMMDAGKLMRQSCQPKFKLSDGKNLNITTAPGYIRIYLEIANGIRDGNIPDTKDVKCYINCILEMTKTMKKGKYQLELGLKQVELMVPDDMKNEYRFVLTTCKDAGNGFKNACDISYEVLKCFYKNAPRFLFP